MTVAPSFNPLEFPALDTVDVSENTAEKPQSKIWEHDDHWWSVLPQDTGTWLWRLDNTTWNPVLQLSANKNVHADVKADGNLAHVLLFDKENTQFRPLEYVPGNQPTYQPWSLQPNLVDVALDSGVETATFDVDSTGRLWLASDTSDAIEVRYADAPYTSFSSPIVVGSGITGDDISTVTAFDNNKIGVFWSNQDTERFGFRYHVDGTNPTVWSADEMPVFESMSTSGGGLADDHVNVATASDGTIYAAVKTSFGGSMPQIGLLVRHPTGSWDPLYSVDTGGTRPVVAINEEIQRVFVFYVENTSGGDIVYRESDLQNISFAPRQVMVSGNLNNPSVSKDAFTDELLVIASKGSTGYGKLVSLNPGGGGGPGGPENQAPFVNAGQNQNVEEDTTMQLFGIVSDDGLPNPPANVTTQWTVVSGPDAANFSNANFPQTSVSFDTPGNYVLRLTANDGEYVSTDDLNVTVTAAGGPTDPVVGLVGHWTLDNMQGNTLADASGQQNNGTAQGNPTLGTGVVDQALQVDGDGDFVLVDDDSSLDINQEITISAWIKPESKSTQYVVTKADHDKIDGYEISLSGSGKVFARFNQDTAGNAYRVDSTTSYPRDGQTWMHVATTYDGSNIKLYVNGQLETTEPASFQIASNDLDLAIGAESNGSREYEGGVDEVRLYNQALDSAQILSLFNLETPTGEPPVNTAPTANAGSNQSVQEGVALQLSGSVNDDGLPNPPANVTTNWTLVSGPGSANFSNANSLQTSVTFNNPGNYVLRLTANDGQYTDSDDVNVQVTSTTPVNQAPQINAGANRSVEEDTPLQLAGSVSDDGLPNPPANVTTSWTLVSGPGSANFSNANSLQTSVTFNNPGDYVLRLTANDGQYTVSDDVNVQVTSTTPVNQAPQVNAGANRSVEEDTPLQLSGSVNDDGLPNPPANVTTNWTLVSGPGSANFSNANSLQTSVTFNNPGDYVLRLTANDGQYTVNDTLNVSVTAASNPGGGGPVAGLVGHWTLDSMQGGTLVDTSGNQNNGTAQGNPTLDAGAVDQALQLDGSGDYVLVEDDASLDANQEITISAWLKPESKKTQYVIKKADQDKVDGYELSLSGGGKVFVRFNQDSAGNAYRVDSTTSYPTDGQTWIHVATTYDGTNIKLYVNGQLETTEPASFQIANNDLDLGIGAESNGSRAAKGGIDEVRLYNQALDSAQILSLFNLETPTGEPPVNTAPTANAGSNQSVQEGVALQLSGSVNDDGLPNPPANVTTSWTLVSGPGSANFSNANSLQTSVTFNNPGNYVLRLTANDGQYTDSDDVNVQVTSTTPVNQAPQVNAGANQSVEEDTPLQLAGSVSDDGLPNPPANVTTSWTLVSGPGSANFSNANSLQTSVTFNNPGDYVLRLTANDGQYTVNDTLNVTVTAASNPGGGGPVAGLVGHWTLDAMQGDTLVDASGNQNNGTAQGNPTLDAGAVDQALQLDGSGDYVLVDDDSSLDITQEITISAWLKPESKKTQYVIKKADQDKVDGFELSLSGSGKVFVRFNQDSAGNAYRVDSTTSYPTDGQTWMHVAATYDGENIKVYVNGQLESTEAANFQIGTNDLDLGIGAEGNGSRSMKGGVDDVRIYNQALTSQEIQALASNQ